MWMKSSNLLITKYTDDVLVGVVIVACYCAGAGLIMWLGEKINEFGIGNGISMILFANIVSGGFAQVSGLYTTFTTWGWGTVTAIVGVGIGLAIVWFMVLVSDSDRRIPVQYAKRVVGRKMYGGQSSVLPLKLNMACVMPIIFASSIISIPATIGALTGHTSAADSTGFWKVLLHYSERIRLYISCFTWY